MYAPKIYVGEGFCMAGGPSESKVVHIVCLAPSARSVSSVDGAALSDGRFREMLREYVVFGDVIYGEEAQRYHGYGSSCCLVFDHCLFSVCKL